MPNWRVDFIALFLLSGGPSFQNHLVTGTGDIDRNTLGIQFPSQHVGLGHILFRCCLGEINGLRERIIHKSLQGSLHADVILGADVC